MKKQCMVLLVENNSGVLARVSSLFMQRGFNIDSLTVSSTENPKISRITIVTTGDQKTFSQILKQTGKLVETKMIFSVESEFSLIRELLLVKFSTVAEDPDDVDMLQDMIMAAVNEAMRTADAAATENMSRLTGGMNLGGLF